MATVTPKALLDGTLLANSIATLYVVPAAMSAVVRSITLCNTDSVDHAVTLHFVPFAGSPSGATMILNALPIKAGQTIEDDLLRVLGTGGSIRAFADAANAVSMRVDGSEVT